MISQNCPKCNSSRVRRGYRPTPIWSKILFRYNLLCDSCNWEFTGFAVPGTVTVKPNKTHKKKQKTHSESNNSAELKPTDSQNLADFSEKNEDDSENISESAKIGL